MEIKIVRYDPVRTILLQLSGQNLALYISDRLHESGKNAHAGSLFAVKNSIESLELKHNLPDSSVVCRKKIVRNKLDV